MSTSRNKAKPAKRGPGRPRKAAPLRVNWRKFELAARAGCSQGAAAGYVGVSIPTLVKRALKKYGKPLAEVMADLQDCGQAERLVAQHELATGIGSGSNAARAAYRPGSGRGGVTVNIGIDNRQSAIADRVDSVAIVPRDILEILPPGHLLIRDVETGITRLANSEESEVHGQVVTAALEAARKPADLEGLVTAQAILPENGFELPPGVNTEKPAQIPA